MEKKRKFDCHDTWCSVCTKKASDYYIYSPLKSQKNILTPIRQLQVHMCCCEFCWPEELEYLKFYCKDCTILKGLIW